jgi:hypothetical protein
MLVFKQENVESLASSHCRGHMFDPCTAHQKFPSAIKHLKATLGAFSLVLSSVVAVYYKS